ncbi:D-arabinose 1-dehydrogenase [Cyphellophora attinorum]|uniref:D-arabinose 1-dehydrogenase n=1 Tax=Cyphellophora attinorum TaxID=1664694 RepID=A0A0N0NPK1_9EURO|nr:D-arabinose 1-dehydrogenase [Phialophora attinorum]KPI42818.1 D-arabinose 1-dehydrogenase [Phialophora attinorum]
MAPRTKLSESLPPLLFGTATFTYQFNVDPYALGPVPLVQKALQHGVRGFDTSPYYGPAESILGDALDTSFVRQHFPRDQYHILTKVGRIGGDVFDYSPEWIRHSVARSCTRLHTDYLDVVYCHDVEFVSPAEVLGAIQELRRIRDEEGSLRYVGICGYPVDVLCDLAEMILRETGEPLDIVQSYANFTIQNTRLLSHGLQRLVNAGAWGTTRQGPPIGAMGNWHPAPDDLRKACANAAKWTEAQGEKLEVVAVRFALENWLREGAKAGSYANPRGNGDGGFDSSPDRPTKVGVNVMGVSKIEELDETMRVWHSVLDGLADGNDLDAGSMTPSDALTDHEWSLKRRQQIRVLAKSIHFAWASPEPGFINKGNPAPLNFRSKPEATGILTPPPSGDDLL